ncbi:MAG: class I SAM-dependent rRNA methyltransferase [Phycisphaerae bacterium]|nr:class I SAM-dependent rRNA methyltransferase [Phycisphaerae bacterium]
MDRGDLQSRIDAAVNRRRPLIERSDLDAYRLFHGESDGVSGMVIERLGPVLIVQFHEGRLSVSPDDARPAVERLMHTFGVKAAYAKYFVRDRSELTPAQAAEHTRSAPWLGATVEPRITVREQSASFIIRPYDGFSYGLFLEHRDNRERIRKLAGGRRVLNLFCYTCGFSIAAAQGGASEVCSVDLSKRYLDWGRANFELNRLDPGAHRFYCSDTLDYFRRVERQGRLFDIVILDPPTFARMRRPARTFVLEKQLGALLTGAARVLDKGGVLLFATNNRAMNGGRIDRELHRAAGGRKCRIIERPGLQLDFAGDPHYSHTVLARFD